MKYNCLLNVSFHYFASSEKKCVDHNLLPLSKICPNIPKASPWTVTTASCFVKVPNNNLT